MDLDRIKRTSTIAAVCTAAGAVVIVITLASAVREIQSLEQQSAHIRDEIAQKARERDQLKREIEDLKQDKAKLEPLALSGLGVKNPASFDAVQVQRSLTANDLFEEQAGDNAARRASVTLRYFPKDFERDLNEDVVLPRMKKLGFRMEVGHPRLSSVPTNSIWFGSSVDVDDVRAAAYVLIAAGLKIKAIRPFRDASGPKHGVIEIGADTKVVSDAPLTAEAIRSGESFRR